MNLTQEQKDRIKNRAINSLSVSIQKLSFLLEEEKKQESIVYKQALISKQIQENILKNLNKHE